MIPARTSGLGAHETGSGLRARIVVAQSVQGSGSQPSWREGSYRIQLIRRWVAVDTALSARGQLPEVQISGVGKAPFYGCSDGCQRGHQVCPGTWPLAPLVGTVRRRRAAVTGPDDVAVHA